MDLQHFFLEQLERDAAASRKVLERVPEGRNNWKPHPRSMELGYLAALVATMPGWPAFMILHDETDLDSKDQGLRTTAVETTAELLELLDKGLENSRQALRNTTEQHLHGTWRLKMGGNILTESPRYRAIADGALSHLAHHRGQLTVYLRLNEAKVPAIYGPSADEWY
ncbi:MAG: hypothetical protein JST93_25075 [Acidobacteria bacterium]|nr:hypothetical protein [Acidobacteriota bacterium]